MKNKNNYNKEYNIKEMPSNHDHFSISKEFNDIIPILNEWIKEEGSTNNRGLKSRNICLAIRFYYSHLKGIELAAQNGGFSTPTEQLVGGAIQQIDRDTDIRLEEEERQREREEAERRWLLQIEAKVLEVEAITPEKLEQIRAQKEQEYLAKLQDPKAYIEDLAELCNMTGMDYVQKVCRSPTKEQQHKEIAKRLAADYVAGQEKKRKELEFEVERLRRQNKSTRLLLGESASEEVNEINKSEGILT